MSHPHAVNEIALSLNNKNPRWVQTRNSKITPRADISKRSKHLSDLETDWKGTIQSVGLSAPAVGSRVCCCSGAHSSRQTGQAAAGTHKLLTEAATRRTHFCVCVCGLVCFHFMARGLRIPSKMNVKPLCITCHMESHPGREILHEWTRGWTHSVLCAQHTHTKAHTRTHAHTHTRTRTHTHGHAHTHTDTHGLGPKY